MHREPLDYPRRSGKACYKEPAAVQEELKEKGVPSPGEMLGRERATGKGLRVETQK